MIRVLHFADIVNRHDPIDTVVQHADPQRFQVGLCVRSERHNIAAPVYQERTPRWVLNGTSRRAIPQAARQLARILRDWKADILHTHHYDQMFIGWLATRLYPRTRLIIGRHYSDAIYRLRQRLKVAIFLGVEQTINRAAQRIIVPSTEVFEILTRRQGISKEKVDLIPHGFEPEKYVAPSPSEIYRIRNELGLHGRFVLGNFGRLHEEKGHRYLLEAAATLKQQIPNLLILLAGEGPERGAIERQIQELDLRGVVRLLGWRRDAITLMASVDIVVQPSLGESFGQVMVEALWMRKPLITTNVGGALDIIKDGENGLLVPKEDAAALATAIERLAGDAALRSRLAEAGRTYVAEHLVISKIIKRYEQSYLRAMES
ncbi:MAG TPA: glycosyltransferase [Blastocatellia bacterium]|nr:glycosyltransferase [Blastocatellia bacterium]